MGHKIIEAVLENGKLKCVDKNLPGGKTKVHLIYDVEDEPLPKIDVTKIVRETSGIYKNTDVEAESKKLRENWERNAH